MKTKELIEELNKSDPTGECDVVVGSSPVLHVIRNPGFYDGCFWSVELDEGNVKSIKLNSKNDKINLWTQDLTDFLWEMVEENNFKTVEDVLGAISFDSEYSKSNWEKFQEEDALEEIVDILSYYSKRRKDV